MSLPTEWPGPGEPDMLDPYPWHGLVYLGEYEGFTVDLLKPSGGRPERLLPDAPPRPRQLPGGPAEVIPINNAYDPVMDCALWDLARPDPPFSQYLYDLGAESISRRVLPVNTGLVRKRVGTSYLFLRGAATAGEWEVWESWNIHLSTAREQIGTLTLTLPDVTLSDPYTGDTYTTNPASGVLQQIDLTKDGRKRLMAVVGGTPGVNDGSAFIKLVFVLEFELQPDDTWTWSTTIVAGLEQCIGTFAVTREVNASRSRLTIEQPGLEVTGTFNATERISSRYQDDSISHGTYSEYRTRTNRVMGGWFTAGGGVELLYADYEFYNEQNVDLAASFSSKASAEDDDYEYQHWRILAQKRRGMEVTLRAGAGSVTLDYEITENLDYSTDEAYEAAGPNGPGIYVTGSVDYVVDELIHGTPAAYQNTYTEGPYVNGFAIEPGILANPALETGRLWAPLRLEYDRAMTLRQANTQCNKAAAMMGGGLAGQPAAPWWLSQALTPSGPMGTPVETVEGSSERCSYNPITGELARQADLPAGQSLVGWL